MGNRLLKVTKTAAPEHPHRSETLQEQGPPIAPQGPVTKGKISSRDQDEDGHNALDVGTVKTPNAGVPGW